MKKTASKVAHNRPKTFFFTSTTWLPRIDFSYYKYVPRLICLHICGSNSLTEEGPTEDRFTAGLQRKHKQGKPCLDEHFYFHVN